MIAYAFRLGFAVGVGVVGFLLPLVFAAFFAIVAFTLAGGFDGVFGDNGQ